LVVVDRLAQVIPAPAGFLLPVGPIGLGSAGSMGRT
jgi:hypothetical protein